MQNVFLEPESLTSMSPGPLERPNFHKGAKTSLVRKKFLKSLATPTLAHKYVPKDPRLFGPWS
jgi:hypothetical protein